MDQSSVLEIYTSPAAGQPMTSCEQVRAVEQRGLEGDRYYLGKGYYSGDKIWDANVTLIESEAYQAANVGTDEPFSTDCLRRNIVTRGLDLSQLLGQHFLIGDAVLLGTKRWPPCSYIDGMHSGRGLLRRFAKSAGIGATVVRTGRIALGDEIRILTDWQSESAS